jgi:DNA-binding NtrC family response regulator
MLADLLRFDDYNVLEAGSGADAMTVAQTHSGPIDLVITDINLHGMSGVELTQKLVQQYPRIGIIYMSGDALSAAAGAGNVQPAAQFLQKPFASTALLDTVRRVLQS